MKPVAGSSWALRLLRTELRLLASSQTGERMGCRSCSNHFALSPINLEEKHIWLFLVQFHIKKRCLGLTNFELKKLVPIGFFLYLE
jgi:hypothetical protein